MYPNAPQTGPFSKAVQLQEASRTLALRTNPQQSEASIYYSILFEGSSESILGQEPDFTNHQHGHLHITKG